MWSVPDTLRSQAAEHRLWVGLYGAGNGGMHIAVFADMNRVGALLLVSATLV
jgi:hypothetical protein